MKITREATLAEALEDAARLLDQMRRSRISFGDHQLSPTDLVTVEIELESKDGEAELEFEIKWRRQGEGQPGDEYQSEHQGGWQG